LALRLSTMRRGVIVVVVRGAALDDGSDVMVTGTATAEASTADGDGSAVGDGDGMLGAAGVLACHVAREASAASGFGEYPPDAGSQDAVKSQTSPPAHAAQPAGWNPSGHAPSRAATE
jgi:hypothetical protein